jgi:hypothetical protein
MNSIYADGIANIAITDGVLRVDLVVLRQVNKENVETKTVAGLALSVPALLRIHDQLGKVIDGMVEQGLLTKRDETEVTKTELK